MKDKILQHIKEQEQELIKNKIAPVSVPSVAILNHFKNYDNRDIKIALNDLIKYNKIYYYEAINDIYLTTKKPKEE